MKPLVPVQVDFARELIPAPHVRHLTLHHHAPQVEQLGQSCAASRETEGMGGRGVEKEKEGEREGGKEREGERGGGRERET